MMQWSHVRPIIIIFDLRFLVTLQYDPFKPTQSMHQYDAIEGCSMSSIYQLNWFGRLSI